MELSKTKSTLIDVARTLFAKKGVEGTTMNDIAEASNKGRRTLYTYFNSKKEIYNAVIQSELEQVYIKLNDLVGRDLRADKKLMAFFFMRLEAIKEVVKRNGTLKADFFRDIWRVENVRKGFDQREINYLETILNEGIAKSIFEIENISNTARIIHYSLKGLEVPTIRGIIDLDINKNEDRELIESIIFTGIKKK
ncbi:MAG: TetR family transcriptional regulator [Dysgonamonadaceae bacterium]